MHAEVVAPAAEPDNPSLKRAASELASISDAFTDNAQWNRFLAKKEAKRRIASLEQCVRTQKDVEREHAIVQKSREKMHRCLTCALPRIPVVVERSASYDRIPGIVPQ